MLSDKQKMPTKSYLQKLEAIQVHLQTKIIKKKLLLCFLLPNPFLQFILHYEILLINSSKWTVKLRTPVIVEMEGTINKLDKHLSTSEEILPSNETNFCTLAAAATK